MILASSPASSCMYSTPTGRASTHTPGIHRVLEQHQRVERVAVAAERVGDEAVVGRIRGGREQAPVEEDPARLVVDLVLVAAATGDLDDDVDAALGGAAWAIAPCIA